MTDSELVIVRGSTPLLVMTVPDKITLSDIADGTITISQKRSGVKIIKKLSEMTFDERNRAYSVFLTQAETLSLDSAWLASIQAKLCDNADVVLVSFMYDVEVLQVNNENILSLDQPSGTAYETPFEGKGIDFLPDLINFQPKIDLESVITSGDYEQLINKPSIGGVTLIGDLSLSDLGAYTKSEIDSTVEEINQKDSDQDTRMNGIDTRIDGVDASIDALDTRADGIDTRIDGVDTRLNNQIGNYVVSRNVESNEYSNSQIDTFFNGFAREIDDLENRIDDQIGLHTLARNVLADEYSNSEIDSKVSAVQGDVDSLETKVNTQLGNYTVSRNVAADEYTNTEIDSALAGKVNTEAGKGLSTNDYTTAEKEKLGALPTASDLSTELDGKVDKITGKGLSTEDYTSAEKTKLSGIETGAQVNKIETVNSIQPDSNKNVSLTAEDIPADGIGDKTVSGNPITVTDALESTARDLQVEFGPIQDLHGYDHPWPEGGGKNLCDPSEKITSGGTVYWYYNSFIQLKAGITYTFSISGASTPNGLYIRNTERSTVKSIYNRPAITYTPTEDIQVYFHGLWNAGQSASDYENALGQLEIGSTATTFEPYSNICPISGRTEVNVERTGKNLFPIAESSLFSNERCSLQYLNNGGLVITTSGAYARTRFKFDVKTGEQYTISFKAFSTGNYNRAYISSTESWTQADIDYGVILNIPENETYYSRTFTATSDTVYVGFYVSTTYVEGQSMNISEFQFELGSTATSYEPYQGQSIQITLGQTIYGGSLDVRNGVLTVTHAIVTAAVSNVSRNNNWQYYVRVTDSLRDGSNHGMWSNKFQKWETGSTTTPGICFVNGNGGLRFNTVAEYETTADMLADIGEINFVYPLATPTKIQLTPQQIQMLEGYNLLTTDGDNIILTYLGSEASNVQDEIDEFENGLNNVIGSIAFIENTTAKTSHAVGEYIILNGIFCKVISAISSGETLSFGTNIQATTIGTELRAIWSQLNA